MMKGRISVLFSERKVLFFWTTAWTVELSNPLSPTRLFADDFSYRGMRGLLGHRLMRLVHRPDVVQAQTFGEREHA